MNTPKQCARAQDKVDLNSGSRALTGHRFRVTHRSEFLVSFVSQDKRNSLAHAMCQWKPAQTSASETFHRNLCGRRYAGDFIVSASADVAGMSPFQPACCLGVGAGIAATSDVSRFGFFRFLLGLYFARESAALRIGYGNPRASDFGLRPKVTKRRRGVPPARSN